MLDYETHTGSALPFSIARHYVGAVPSRGKNTAVVEPRSGDISARVQEKGKKITGEARRSRACPSRLGGEGRLVVAAATAAGQGGCRVATAKKVAVAVAREAGVRWVRHGGW